MKTILILLTIGAGAFAQSEPLPPDSWVRLSSQETEATISQQLDAKNFEAIPDLTNLAETHKNPAIRSLAWLALGQLRVEGVPESEQKRLLIDILNQEIGDRTTRSLKSWAARELVARGEVQFKEKAYSLVVLEYSDPSRVEEIMAPVLEKGEIIKAYGNTEKAYRAALKSNLWMVKRWGLERIGNNPEDRNDQLFRIFLKMNRRYDLLAMIAGRAKARASFSVNDIRTYNFVISGLKAGGRNALGENLVRVDLILEK